MRRYIRSISRTDTSNQQLEVTVIVYVLSNTEFVYFKPQILIKTPRIVSAATPLHSLYTQKSVVYNGHFDTSAHLT